MAQVSACPDDRQLQSILDGQAAPDDMEAFAAHLEQCQSCAQRLDRGLAGDTLVEAMQAQATVPDHASDPAVQPLIERLLLQHSIVQATAAVPPDATAEFSGAAGADPEADDLSFLGSPQAPDEIGRLGSYRVLKVLGSGGMGLVFQAEDVHLKRRVALKVMKPEVAKKPMAKARFLREAQAAAAIEHDHIVTIHQVGEDRGVPFLAMQWLKGLSLEDRLKQGGVLQPAQVVRIGRQIALGLAAAHDQSLIHRDIKPANLWLTPEQGGRIKILDFGLARALADDAHITQSGAIVGTPSYMAPEQARGDPIDHRCDLFSLGVVLYRLTTGRLPFRGNNTMAVLSSLATDQPESPRSLVGDLPAELSDLIVQLLAKDPAQRPATARAVADRLQAIDKLLGSPQVDPQRTQQLMLATAAPGPQRQEPAQAIPPALLARKAGSKRRLAIAAALGALALLVAGAVIFLQTPNGTIRIEINDDSIEAVLTKNGAVIKGADKAHDINVAAGEQGLKITRGDLEFETAKFVLKKGETIRLKIELLPGKVQVVQGKQVIGEKALGSDRTAAEWALSLGGTVTIDDGKERAISAAKDLPAGPWTLHDIALNINKQVDDAGLKELTGLQSLRTLGLDNTKVTDAGLKELAGLRSLQSLELSSTTVTDAGLKELAGLNSLKALHLAGTAVTDAGLKELAGLTSLQYLSLNNTQVTDAGLKELAGLKSLQALSLRGTKATAQAVAVLHKALPGCQIDSDVTPAAAGSDRRAAEWALALGGTVTIDDGKERAISAAKELPAGPWTLRRIELKNSQQVDDAGLKTLAGLTSLQQLSLTGTRVTNAGLKELVGLKSLQELSLAHTEVTGAGLTELAGLTSLQALSLYNTKVTDVGLEHLAGLKSLHRIYLDYTQVTDAGLKELAGLTSLQWLSLDATQVTDAGLQELVGLKSLQELSLAYTQVTGGGLKELAGLKSLQALGLGGTQVTDARLKELAGLTSLTTLDLGATKVTDTGLKELAGLTSLQCLDLSSTKVTDAGLKELAGLKSLQKLILNVTQVTDAGLKELAGLKSLQVLGLAGTQVTDAGLVHLQGLANLTALDLTKTPVTAKGVAALKKALPGCQIRESP